jgi:integrase
MPAEQRGSVIKRGRRWAVRYYDEYGRRRFQGGFQTKTAARAFAARKADEVVALRRGDALPAEHRPQTVATLLDGFLERHGATVDPATLRKLTAQLKQPRTVFGDRHPDSLNRLELEDWRQTLSPGSRHDVFRAFRQALAWAAARSLCTRDASAGIKNPKRKRHERRDVFPFESWVDVEAVAHELDPRYRALPLVAVGCGLRPEELFGLHRADVDRAAGVLHVRRRFTGGELKPGTKTGPGRIVPLRQRVLEALETLPPRIDTPRPVPGAEGRLHRHRAVQAPGVDAGSTSGWDRPSADLRLPPHIRDVGDRERRAGVLPRGRHGHFDPGAGGHLLPMAAADERPSPRSVRCLRRRGDRRISVRSLAGFRTGCDGIFDE